MIYCVCHFPSDQVDIDNTVSWRNNTYWRFLQIHIEHSPIIFLNDLNYTPTDFREQAKYI
jgi:hypothetical protein